MTIIFTLLFVLTLCYFVPSFVALLRGHHKLLKIVALNFLLGWTVIGWLVALVWSFRE